MVRAIGFAALCFLGLTVTFHRTTLACSCAALPAIYDSYKDADAVFVGKVVSSNEPAKNDKNYKGDDVIFEFDVVESFKGISGKRIKLNRGTARSSCYSGYTVGTTYLVYADRRALELVTKNSKPAEDTVFQGSICQRSTSIDAARDQLLFIRRMLRGEAEPLIYGSVGRSSVDFITDTHAYRYLEGVAVVLSNEANRFETKTDRDGLFTFNKIPPGTYELRPEPTDSSFVYYPAVEVLKIGEDNSITAEDPVYPETYKNFFQSFSLGWKNRFDGHVYDRSGVRVDRYECEPVHISKPGRPIDTIVDGSPGSNLRSGFSSIGDAPGKYVLALDVYAPFAGTNRKRFYYPGVEDFKSARIFDVTPSSQFTSLEFPVPFTVRRITGKFFWADGQPAWGRTWVDISRHNKEDSESNPRFGWQSGDGGEFTIQALEGFEYWVRAQISVTVKDRDGEDTETMVATPQKVKIGDSDLLLKFVVTKPKNLVTSKGFGLD